MPASVPGLPPPVPCQKPRPGQACSTAMPMKNSPIPPSSSRPNPKGPKDLKGSKDLKGPKVRGLRQASSGSAISAPATT